MSYAASQYQRTSEAGISGRGTECAAFSMVNRELATCLDGPARLRALGRNHTLWSILVKDLALADNRLPDGVKAELIKLGLWSMRYSTLAILNHLPAQPLIEVNSNVAEGLLSDSAVAPPSVAVFNAALSA